MSTIIIITPPPTKPPGTGAKQEDGYAEAREVLDQAEADGMRVRVVRDDE